METSEYWEVELSEDRDGGSVWFVEVEHLGSLELARTALASEIALGNSAKSYRIVHIVRTVVE